MTEAAELTDFIGEFTTDLRKNADRLYALQHLGYATAVTMMYNSDHPDLAELDRRGITITGKGADRLMASIDLVAGTVAAHEGMPLEAAQARIHRAWRMSTDHRPLWDAVANGTISRYQARTIENHAERFTDRVATIHEVVDDNGVVTDLIADEGDPLLDGDDYQRVLTSYLTTAVAWAEQGFTGRKLATRCSKEVRALTPGYELVVLQKNDDRPGLTVTPCEDGLTAHNTLLLPLDLSLRLKAWSNAAADNTADAAQRAGVDDHRNHGERVTDAIADLIRDGLDRHTPAHTDSEELQKIADVPAAKTPAAPDDTPTIPDDNRPHTGGRTHKPATSVQIHVRATAETFLGLSDEEATIDGYGPVPAHIARALATSTGAMWRKVVLDPGTLDVIDVGAHAYPISAALRRFIVQRDEYCTAPGCHVPAADCDLDHIIPWPTGPTTAENLQAHCRGHHRRKTQYVYEATRAQRARHAARNPGPTELWPGLPDEPPF